ncbi:hypothetical protein HN789_04635 [archaeon]|jgi:DNA-binding MarR family transcriptional regulator|nr:hypothetical protein [archaeon]MBT4022443.1 hypothetical protein [archaeon]MBT4272598.1 hypothetical protein [archaeon]MBT4461236.1 hypothetical protein [archaeon]MBT4858250.1 hypothetical protein [archaeon]
MKKHQDEQIKTAFTKVKEEMTDHLDAINENTNEINSTSNYVKELEKKINKLNEKIEDLTVNISEARGESSDFAQLKNIHLKPKEAEVFKLLYENMGDLFDYRKIARALGLTQNSVKKKISSMISKGIPIIKKYFEDNTFLVLDPDFRNLQAKNNIIKLNK